MTNPEPITPQLAAERAHASAAFMKSQTLAEDIAAFPKLLEAYGFQPSNNEYATGSLEDLQPVFTMAVQNFGAVETIQLDIELLKSNLHLTVQSTGHHDQKKRQVTVEKAWFQLDRNNASTVFELPQSGEYALPLNGNFLAIFKQAALNIIQGKQNVTHELFMIDRLCFLKNATTWALSRP